MAAFKRFYECKGTAYTYASVYNGAHYPAVNVGPHDCLLDTSKTELWLANVIGDMMSGRQGSEDPATFDHFCGLLERLAPDALQLEQPFMWPLAKRLRQLFGHRKPRLIYSSHNVEGPLKRGILVSCRVPSRMREEICSEIEQMEAEIAREADLIVCVSEADQDFYHRELRSHCPVIVVRNGADRSEPAATACPPNGLSRFEDHPYLMTMASAHVPTIDGLCHYLIDGGVFCVPPAPSIAICGGIAEQIYHRPEYQRYLAANSTRVQFFPDISDSEMLAIKHRCHGVFLPIRGGGGTNLKTAEALALGRWIVATSTALRGFETFLDAEGLIIADNSADFRHAMRQVLRRPPLELTEASRATRDALYWDRCFTDSDLPAFIENAHWSGRPAMAQSFGESHVS